LTSLKRSMRRIRHDAAMAAGAMIKWPVSERTVRRALAGIAAFGIAGGIAAHIGGGPAVASRLWTAATVPVLIALAISIVRDLAAGRMGIDAIALMSMAGALGLGEPLAGAVVALMYAGGTVLEDLAVARAERDLRALTDRRRPHRGHCGGGRRHRGPPACARR
jgi:cation transport ATPase